MKCSLCTKKGIILETHNSFNTKLRILRSCLNVLKVDILCILHVGVFLALCEFFEDGSTLFLGDIFLPCQLKMSLGFFLMI